jgi:diguanylate cyclase (GGDEF)-like protein/putative nucleotidyltransferase with HDIG domain
LVKVKGTTDEMTYNISWLLYGFTFVLFGAPSALVVIIVAHIVETIWLKIPWHVQVFNMASYALALSSADLIRSWINPQNELYSLASTVSLIAAIGTFTLINHIIMGLIIWLREGQTIQQSGVLSGFSLMIDFTMIGLGIATAILWTIYPSAVLLNLIPLYLIYRTLEMPSLRRQTELDPKIKLYNSEYFAQALEKELVRSNRYQRPLSVVFADLDLLRNINNTYGHLAGDVVLHGVAEILQDQFPAPDVVARFGGEEFAILIPETKPKEALERVEATREAIEAANFEVSTSVTPIKITISFGISGRNGAHETFSADELVHNADVALYESKISGRNTIRIYTGEGVDNLFQVYGDKKIHRLGLSDYLHSSPQVASAPSKPLTSNWEAKPNQKIKNKIKSTSAKSDKKVRWMIALMTLFAFSLLLPIFHVDDTTDWVGIAAFALIVIIAEGFSIDIYVKDTSISTSTAPFIAGLLLFGPAAVPVLSFALAGTAMVKHRSPIKRFLFNFSNYLVAGTLCVWLIWLSPYPFVDHPVIVQISFAMFSGVILFVSSTTLLAKGISFSMEKNGFKLWSQHFSWLWPYHMAFGFTAYAFNLGYYYAGVPGILALLVPLWLLRQSQSQHLRHTEGLVSQLQDNNKELEGQRDTIEALNEGLLLSLANAIDLRDPFTYGHSRNVSRYASLIAKEIGLEKEHINRISKASLLHDIGKLGIPEMILFKDGPLSPVERKIIQEHPELGTEIIRACPSMDHLIPAILHHHERFDGTGYPNGLAGEEIPMEARIIGLADAIEAMTSDRPYRRGLNFEELIGELRKESGKQFDPLAVKAFMRIAQRKGEALIVNSGRIVASDNPTSLEILSMYSNKIGGTHADQPIDFMEYEMT